jgi:hypothetical protein
MMKKAVLACVVIALTVSSLLAQHSVAREWNEVLLTSIRVDIGRPTVHARNLFQISAAMYDAWAAFDEVADPYLLGQEVHGVTVPFDGIAVPADPQMLKEARNIAISYAAYRLMIHRFKNSPGVAISQDFSNSLMETLGFDTAFVSTDYSGGSAAALGNYIAQNYIAFGLQDGSHEADGYGPLGFSYLTVNPPMNPNLPGTQGILDLNRWQPLSFNGNQTPFLSPHWGEIAPFSLTEDELTIYERDGEDFFVYHDPGAPPSIDTVDTPGLTDDYKWTFALVAMWSAHLDPDELTMIDISPAALGNIAILPKTIAEMREFYKFEEGGIQDVGYALNPKTGEPYVPQLVPRGDFGRVIAEFWADGPASETPPGHWFTILNYVSDHPLFEKRFEGQGPELDNLEWDVKSYFILGGAIHDVAISVWGMKCWYDYVRPISAIRAMAALGQSSDSTAMSYHPGGMPLVPWHIELVLPGDVLAGAGDEHVGKIKIFAWRGPEWIADPNQDYAGVDWILAENWWPYQRPSFVTPPFAGYVSGHSTFSRAAAEVMTLLTGDPYFPGGLGEFHTPKDDYLVFEQGPSVDMTLQWATYRDASDQASLSRIWGGIHPPVDDIPGRRIGQLIGPEAFAFAKEYFEGNVSSVEDDRTVAESAVIVSPNPITDHAVIGFTLAHAGNVDLIISDLNGKPVAQIHHGRLEAGPHHFVWNASNETGQAVPSGIYICQVQGEGYAAVNEKVVVVH